MEYKSLNMLSKVINLPAWQKTVLALILGVILGFSLGPKAVVLQPVGDLFINAIHMLIVPVITTAIINAILNLGDQSISMGRILTKAFFVYAISMLFSCVFAILIAKLLHPGLGVHYNVMEKASETAKHFPTLGESFSNLIPNNLIGAFAEPNILQILIFSALLGIAIVKTPREEAKQVANFFRSFYKVVFNLVHVVMSFAPFGIAALLAVTVGTSGGKTLLNMIAFVGSVYIACASYIIFYYGFMIKFFTNLKPTKFFQIIYTPALLGFLTSSSAATLPVSLDCAEKGLKINRGIAGFLLPLGSSFNLNGLSIYLTVATVFAANMYDVTLTFSNYVTIALTIMMTAMGAAAVPGTALVIMGIIMTSVGVPIGALGLIAGVDRFNDMAQTGTNVIGDLFSCYLVANENNSQEQEDLLSNLEAVIAE